MNLEITGGLSALVIALVTWIYFLGKKNGANETELRQARLQLQSEKDYHSTIDAQLQRLDDKTEGILTRINHVNLAGLSDPALTELSEDPTGFSVPDSEPTMEATTGSSGTTKPTK